MKYPIYPTYPCGCNCAPERFRRDCFYYGESIDMGAIIHFCGYDGFEIIEDCNKCNCPDEERLHYISNAEARKILKKVRGEN